MKAYTKDFYETRHRKTVYSANAILSIVLKRIRAIDSAVDVGCGVGTWLSVLNGMGVSEILGIDGDWVDQSMLVIPRSCFMQADLAKSVVRLPRRYDLAVSMEVAEHLPDSCAKEIVAALTQLSDRVLFSAAIPHQGGLNHVNEQWQDYWARLFARVGYEVQDFIRPMIWDDEQIPYWYRQNTLFFSRGKPSVPDLGGTAGLPGCLNLVHPQLYLDKVRAQAGVRNNLRMLRRSLGDYVSRRLGIGDKTSPAGHPSLSGKPE